MNTEHGSSTVDGNLIPSTPAPDDLPQWEFCSDLQRDKIRLDWLESEQAKQWIRPELKEGAGNIREAIDVFVVKKRPPKQYYVENAQGQTVCVTWAELQSAYQTNQELIEACNKAIRYEQSGRGEPKDWLACCVAATTKAYEGRGPKPQGARHFPYFPGQHEDYWSAAGRPVYIEPLATNKLTEAGIAKQLLTLLEEEFGRHTLPRAPMLDMIGAAFEQVKRLRGIVA